MRNRVNTTPRLLTWRRKATSFILGVWDPFDDGFGFIGARRAGSSRWIENPIPVDASENDVVKLFGRYPRDEYDLYFTPNAFRKSERKQKNALPTPYSWADIDDADPDAFVPPPSTLIESSDGRYQGIWRFCDWRGREKAEEYSKALAYKFGADRSGWTVTKYLRVPYTINHKPEYRKPKVKLLRSDLKAKTRPRLLISHPNNKKRVHISKTIAVDSQADWRPIYEKYKSKLGLYARQAINVNPHHIGGADRSVCIYMIVAALTTAGASAEETALILWSNPFFLSKHGDDQKKLIEEVTRIRERVGSSS